jgi:hypothetical protein
MTNPNKSSAKLLPTGDGMRLEDFSFNPFFATSISLPTTRYELSVDRQQFIQKVTPQVHFFMKEYYEARMDPNQSKFEKNLAKLGFPGIEGLMSDPQLCGEFISHFASAEVIELLIEVGVSGGENLKKVINSFEAIRSEGDRVILTCQVYDRVKPRER